MPAVKDVKLQMDKTYTSEQIEESQFNVFKFAASHYISVMQRAEDKTHLPTMVKYLKAYMNFKPEWAQWFLKQFCNAEVLKECFFENPNKLMRSIMTGLIYCAMLKVYDLERAQLMLFWVDVKAKSQVLR